MLDLVCLRFRFALGVMLVLALALTSCGGGAEGAGSQLGQGGVLKAPDIVKVLPATAKAGGVATFATMNNGGPATQWEWKFGGCCSPSTSNLMKPAGRLGGAGTYSCTVTASNDAGSDSFGFSVTITEGSGGTGGGTGGGGGGGGG